MKQKQFLLWNKEKTEAVSFSKIRNIAIRQTDSNIFEVKGWYNDEEYFYFGWFATNEQAIEFVDNIKREIEK